MRTKWQRSGKLTWQKWQKRGMPADRVKRFSLADLLRDLQLPPVRPLYDLNSLVQSKQFQQALAFVRKQMQQSMMIPIPFSLGCQIEDGRIGRRVNVPLILNQRFQQEAQDAYEVGRRLLQQSQGMSCAVPWIPRTNRDKRCVMTPKPLADRPMLQRLAETGQLRPSLLADMRSRLNPEPGEWELTVEFPMPENAHISETLARVRTRIAELRTGDVAAAAVDNPEPPAQHWRVLCVRHGRMGTCYASVDGVPLLVPVVEVTLAQPLQGLHLATVTLRPEWLARSWGGWGGRRLATGHQVFFLDEHEWHGVLSRAAEENQPGFALNMRIRHLRTVALDSDTTLLEWDSLPMSETLAARVHNLNRRQVSLGYTCTVEAVDATVFGADFAISDPVIHSIAFGDRVLRFDEARRAQEYSYEFAPAREVNEQQQERLRELLGPSYMAPPGITDASCKFYNASTWLRCAVNPAGPCNSCGDYRSIPALDDVV